MEKNELPLEELCCGLTVLLKAYDWPRASGFDPRQFAVKIGHLRDAGFSETQLSWLICGGFLDHLHEFTQPGDKDRTFRDLGRWNFRKRSCFVLSPAGADFARRICQQADSAAVPLGGKAPGVPRASSVRQTDQPRWDRECRHLSLGDESLMQLSSRAKNLICILDTFQEDGWSPQIDDPLSSIERGRSKIRLRGAIEKLNRSLFLPRIHFSGDGSGESICWNLVNHDNHLATH
jgi:hypothetical protein